MAVDLTKLVLHSGYPAFKNTTSYSGSFNISGTSSGGTNTVSTTVALTTEPELLDITFNGQSDESWEATDGDRDARPSSAWFKNGAVWVRGDNAGAGYNNYATRWIITSELTGLSLVIKATAVQTFTAVLTLTSTPVYYKIVDYIDF